MQIIPMRDLKNIVEICAREDGSVCITKKRYGCLVVMNTDYYERTMHKMYEAKMLLEGLKDVKAGRMIDGDTAISSLRNKYGI